MYNSKLTFNAKFQGKLGQRATMTKKVYCTKADEFYRLVLDETNEVQEVNIISPLMVRVSYCKDDEYTAELPNTSSIHGPVCCRQAQRQAKHSGQ